MNILMPLIHNLGNYDVLCGCGAVDLAAMGQETLIRLISVWIC